MTQRHDLAELIPLLNLERPIVVLDLETTGVNVKLDRIVQLGIIKLYPNGEVTEWETLVNPGVLIDPDASAVHKITDDMVRDAPTFASLGPKVLAGLTDCDLLGYNLKVFDIPLLQEEFARCNIVYKEPCVVDVFRLYTRLSPRNLTAAVKEYLGETFDAAHDALADVRMTVRVLIAMLKRHDDVPRSVRGIHDLLFKAQNGLDAAGKFAWKGAEVVVNFGKWQGHRLSDAKRTCPGCGTRRCACIRGYLQWMIEKDFADDTKKIARDALMGAFPARG